ncbi:ankyrin repeat domain-containing protein [Allofrancisella guangzhouensis]|uniref:ankyrin repeat domain-containing protein n=1 Tax=Allofrancisella guangzhouensis TaxID=594679 RepID=UPI00190692E3|nr:ankyrin repeat domain-containing protein [Allofrancisella guangzhouensis]MBK2026649.1 ankyrin repeat domain-containing protein [Allofrancisella guangzhouensis]
MSYYNNLYTNIQDISYKCGWGNYYEVLKLPRGLCFGLAAMWGQAYLAHDLSTFYKRLRILTSETIGEQFNGIRYTKLTELINAVCDYERQLSKYKSAGQVNYYASLGQEKKTYELVISIRAFLDGLVAYQCHKYRFLYGGECFGQSILKTSPLVINRRLTVTNQKILNHQSDVTYQKVSPLIEVFSSPFIGDKQDYIDFLKPLVNSLSKNPFPSYISVSSIAYRTAHNIVFNTGLELYDANRLYDNDVGALECRSIEELVDRFFSNVFRLDIESHSLLTLNISVFTSPKYKNRIKQFSIYPDYLKVNLIKEEVNNKLNGYINRVSLLKSHYNSAKYVRDKLICYQDIGDIYSYLSEEYKILKNGGQGLKMRFQHYENKAAFLSNSSSEYYTVIKQILDYIHQIYFRKIVDDVDHYKGMLLKNIFIKGYYKSDNFLYIACRKGHKEIVKLLLDKNINNVNKVISNGTTPLYAACECGHKEIVELLLANNADINKTKRGINSLDIACYAGHTEIVKLLLAHKVAINQTKDIGIRPLFYACKKGYTEISKLLLELGKYTITSINKVIGVGETLLYTACRKGHIEIVDLLLSNGADIKKATNFGVTPLYAACWRGHTEIVKLLLEKDVLASNNSIANYFLGGCHPYSNNQILDSLKKHFWKHNINTPGYFPQVNGGTETSTPLIRGCYFMDNRSIKWLLNNYKELNNATIFRNKCALGWYQIHKNKVGYDIGIEKRLKLLLK